MHSAVRPEKAGRKELQGQKRLVRKSCRDKKDWEKRQKRLEKKQKEKAEKSKKLR